MSFNQALENIKRNGGEVGEQDVQIKFQAPVKVAFEKGFEGMFPVERRRFNWEDNAKDNEASLEFDGTGIVISGGINSEDHDYVAEIEFSVDGVKDRTMKLPASYLTRSPEMFWKYQLTKGHHTIGIKWLNPDGKVNIRVGNVLVYSDEPFRKVFLSEAN
jgi:hypothetical protein